jgi:hypothetical protein
MLPADHPCIEVGNGHRRGADRRLAIDLGVMALVDLRIIAAQPDAADREPAIALALRNAGFLQQQQSVAAGAQKDELGRGRPHVTALAVGRVDAPASARLAADVGNAM